MKIPRVIFRTWKTKVVPDKWSSSTTSLQRYASEYTTFLYTDEENRELVKIYFPEYLGLYDSFDRTIYRVDMVRYIWLYVNGGIYMDLDLELIKPLDSLFSSDAELYLAKTPAGGYTNAFMASAPGCQFWLKCLETIKWRWDNPCIYAVGDLKVLWTTGPGMVTAVAEEHNEQFITLPKLLAHPCSVCDKYLERDTSTEYSYFKELKGSSWTNPSTEVVYFCMCRWDVILAVVLLLVVVLCLIFL